MHNADKTRVYDHNCPRCKISVRNIFLHNDLRFTYVYILYTYINLPLC